MNHQKLVKILQSGKPDVIKKLLKVLGFQEILDVMDFENKEIVQTILTNLPLTKCSQVIPFFEQEQLDLIIQLRDQKFLTSVLNRLDSDDVTGLLRKMPHETAQQLLDQLDDKVKIHKLLSYPPETAGGIMQCELLKYQTSHTIAQVIKDLKKAGLQIDQFYKIYVLDGEVLVGTVGLTTLIYAEPNSTLKEVAKPITHSVTPEIDQEEVAHIFAEHDLTVIPVIDEQMHLLGRITFDDIHDIVEEEADEDIAHFAGTFKEEVANRQTPLIKKAFYRMPWLLFGIGGSVVSAKLISMLDFFNQSSLILASLAPLVMTTSGNIGAQTSMINARELSLDSDKGGLLLKNYLKSEVLLSIIIALSISLISGLASYALFQQKLITLALVVGTLMSIITSSILGVLVPHGFNKLNIDPALATGPLMTPLCDIVALCSFFLGALLILNQ
jgi:magnesium transporter